MMNVIFGKSCGDLVSAYAQRLLAAAGHEHHVVSPLGAWLMLALVAPLATGPEREEMERVLGCDARRARRMADELLADPHPDVALAFAAWSRSELGGALAEWSRSLPACATTGGMPTQTQADQWVLDHTRGQMTSMPARLDDDSELLLASAIATEVQWIKAFELVPASELEGPWATRVERVLRRHYPPGGLVVAHTESAGLVGVSVEWARQRLGVISVIAAPDVAPARVLAAACEVAAKVGRSHGTARFIGAFDLPLTGHSWKVIEYEVVQVLGRKRLEVAHVTIPAWRADTRLEGLLATPGTGFTELVSTLGKRLPPDPRGRRAGARQAASARFDTNGFSAAATTALAMTLGMRMSSRPRPTRARRVEVRFNRPFAVVAIAKGDGRGGPGGIQWSGLPVFTAWVTEPIEPSERNEVEEREEW